MAMADIAKFGTERAISLTEIANRQHLPIAYLEQLFAKLREAGLVVSVRGRSGGYRLGRDAGEIVIVEILKAVDEPTRMTRCLDGEGPGCVGDERCLTHGLWSALGKHIRSFLSGVTLADVIDEAVAGGNAPLRSSLEVAAHG